MTGSERPEDSVSVNGNPPNKKVIIITIKIQTA